MRLTKYNHATVVFEKDGKSIVVDPGKFTPEAAELVASADAVLITHDHFDHFDADVLSDETPVYAPSSIIDSLGFGTAVTGGEHFETAGFDIDVFGDKHAIIWGTTPDSQNAAFLIDNTVYHPGDSYSVPGVAVDTLLVPTSGPWWKLAEAVDFIHAVKPRQSIQIHELMASEAGQGNSASMLGVDGFGGVPFIVLQSGESTTL